MQNNNAMELTVTAELAGSRLDACTATLSETYSRTQVQKSIESGLLSVNGTVESSKKRRMEEGDVITFTPPPDEIPDDIEGENIPLDILYEDDSLMVLNKPAGMVVHPAAGNWTGTVVNAVLGRNGEMNGEFEEEDPIRPGIVHRLDKDTSGCLVVAKNAEAMHRLSKSFADRKVEKTYAAIVSPAPKVNAGMITTLIGRHPVNRKKMAVVRSETLGKKAITSFTVAERGKIGNVSAALLHVRIMTGRTHQIRVHMSYYGSPVIGDNVYGGNSRIPAPRQMLHAWKISFNHPVSGDRLSFEAPFPDDFMEYRNRMNLNGNAVL